MTRPLIALSAVLSLLAGCGDDGRPTDAGRPADAADDAGADATIDSGEPPSDTGTLPDGAVDATTPTDAAGDGDADTSAGCVDDEACDDGDVCTGTERCLDGVCVSADALDCDDGDPCTADTCDAATGCASALVDGDLDGYAPSSLGAACRDCDDGDMSVNPDAADLVCDGVDSDCDETIDEDGFVTHAADCDGDLVPADGAETTLACAAPAAAPSSCPGAMGSWTTFTFARFDCRDDLAGVSPRISGYRTTPIAGEPAATDYDYNCDGVEEPRFTTMGSCVPTGMSTGMVCTLIEGWMTAAPACGVSGFYIDSCAMSPGPGGWECLARGGTMAQACR